MPQNADTGPQGLENGYRRANEIGALLGAARISNNSNDFRWEGRTVVIKTGSSVVVTPATLRRAAAIIYGKETRNGWELYEIHVTDRKMNAFHILFPVPMSYNRVGYDEDADPVSSHKLSVPVSTYLSPLDIGLGKEDNC
jgi:hypothetical protein